MRLLGAQTLRDLKPIHVSCTTRRDNRLSLKKLQVNTRAVEQQIYDRPAGLGKLNMWMSPKL